MSEGGSLSILVDRRPRPNPKFQARTELPGNPVPKGTVSVWSVLKSMIGKDLSRITLPIGLNEPITFLQRLAEYMEHSELLNTATRTEDPLHRMELVSAFAVSTLSSVRLTKPFNPLLHETYELSRPELGFRFIAEQVSHHPPISAFHAQSNSFEFSGTVAPRVKFWGRSVECDPGAAFTLKLLRKEGIEIYTWNAVSCTIYNIIMGSMYICANGSMTIVSHATPFETKLSFKGANQNKPDLLVEGDVLQNKTKVSKIYGNWAHFLASIPHKTYSENSLAYEQAFRRHCDSLLENCPIVVFKGSRFLWSSNEKPPKAEFFYNFTHFTMMLNEMPPSHSLPKTDCRFRPDLKFFELGDIPRAEFEKNRVEEKQRSVRKKSKKGKKEKDARWFKYIGKDAFGRDNQWEFEDNYWNRTAVSETDDIF
ncbi:unnamed protein product [Bursaphelenchus xylophilus]|uniref:Oxysterol-binding protein n=1 Tax=Bursaphelenchus xylophilus TaxID=6326 RepID=A0A1I7SDC7_BURXY|nr:unnamed protein product [Bursaphelenchus xylophilus]CAG9130601.1 unnamed protein product [Bursaphelenchus xylophilus]